MALPRLLIADSSEAFCQDLTQALAEHFQVLCCHDGNTALALLRRESFDFLVLNLMLPENDGITILENLPPERIPKNVLALTPFTTEYVSLSAERLHIGYVIRKPCRIPNVANRIWDMHRQPPGPALPTRDMYAYLSELLIAFPMNPHNLGYKLFRAAILISVSNPNLSATKELYPAAAAMCQRTGCNVERNMRSTLDNSWASPNHRLWQQYFPNAAKRPSSSEFIARIAGDLRLKLSQGLLDPWTLP